MFKYQQIRGKEKLELSRIRTSVETGLPYGSSDWLNKVVKVLGLESLLHPKGRPKKGDTRIDYVCLILLYSLFCVNTGKNYSRPLFFLGKVVKVLGLESLLKPKGRPKKEMQEQSVFI